MRQPMQRDELLELTARELFPVGRLRLDDNQGFFTIAQKA